LFRNLPASSNNIAINAANPVFGIAGTGSTTDEGELVLLKFSEPISGVHMVFALRSAVQDCARAEADAM